MSQQVLLNGALVGVLLSQSASPSVVLSFLLRIDQPWFLTEGKACCCAHHTFRLGFPNCLAIIIIINYTPAISIRCVTTSNPTLFLQYTP
jgi:hypothetical protein